jgi:S1-C subfamily serine protease
VSGVDDLLSMIERKRPGDEVTVTIRRGGKSQQVKVRLGAGE